MVEVKLEKRLCHSDEFPNDSMREIEIDLGKDDNDSNGESKSAKVLLIKQHNRFYCLGTKCSHYSVPLVNGVIYRNRLRCFAHGACFDIKTGDIEDYPGVDCLPKFELFVDQNRDVYLRATRAQLVSAKRVRDVKDLRRRQSSTNDEHRPCSVNIKDNDRFSASMKEIKSRCLIIGSGAAGLLALETLREAGYGSNITMLTRDEHLPYDRPKLSKALDSKINQIKLRDEAFFSSSQINFFPNQQVDTVDFHKRQVRTTSGRSFDYDRLIIATGLKSVTTQKNSHMSGIFTLRSLADANEIAAHFGKLNDLLATSRKVNIILVGGSFISMEVAGYFSGKAANVTVMSRRPPFESTLGVQVSRKIQNLHESKGVRFIIDPKFEISEFVESKDRQGCLEAIKLNDGSQWPVDIVLLAIGGTPVTEFLRNTTIKLTLENFIYVDSHMRTNEPNVYAAGDITYFPRACLAGLDSTIKNKQIDHVNIGHWGVASSQGRVAAESIIQSDFTANNVSHSHSKPFKIVPFFWTTQHGKNIRFAGINDRHDEIVFHEDKTKANELKFAAFYLNGGKCVAVATLDWDPICALFAEALYNGIEVKKEHISSDPLDLKQLLVY